MNIMKRERKEYLEREFARISERILADCAENKREKGWIIADDNSGELTGCVKRGLRYKELKNAGKVYEIDIDDTWTPSLRKKGENPGRECWNKLVAGAYKANHGLLVLNITNIEIFAHCRKLKQLVYPKENHHQRPLIALAPESKQDITPIDREFFIDKTIPTEFVFDGYVLMIINGISWEDVREYAFGKNGGEFVSMMAFYRELQIKDSMALFDLTKGKYSSIVASDYESQIYGCLDNLPCGIVTRGIADWLLSVPVFLVDTCQSCSYIPVQGKDCAVLIPEDKWTGVSYAEENAGLAARLKLWSLPELEVREDSKESEIAKTVPSKCWVDRFGVYISDDSFMPHRIFVWVDKIERYASYDPANATALLTQVILHELAHAYLDVRGRHNDKFTYSHPAYRFIEEALANALSLHLCMYSFSSEQYDFIDRFVKGQGDGYSEGLDLFNVYSIKYIFGSNGCGMWKTAKAIYDSSVAQIISKALGDNIIGDHIQPNWLRDLTRGISRLRLARLSQKRANASNNQK